MGIKHKKQSAKPEGADASKISAAPWNDDHAVTSVDFPLTDPVSPIHGSTWLVLVSSNPPRVQQRIYLNGVTYIMYDILDLQPAP